MNEERLHDMSLMHLIAKFDKLHEAIANNDGRLSTSSSAQLDMEMEEQEDVAYEILQKLGVAKLAGSVARQEIRAAKLAEPVNAFLQILLRIGLVSRKVDGEFHWPIYLRPRHMWLYSLKHEPLVEVFRNRPGVIKWIEGRWLPWRWGVCIWAVEIGDRGSHHGRLDRARVSLFKRH